MLLSGRPLIVYLFAYFCSLKAIFSPVLLPNNLKRSKCVFIFIFFIIVLSQWMSFIAFRTNQLALTKCGVRCDCLPRDGVFFFYDGTEKALPLLSSFFLFFFFYWRHVSCLGVILTLYVCPFKKKKSIFLWSKFWATYLFNLQQGSEDHSPVCVYMSECLRESLSLCLLLFFFPLK